MFFIIARHKWCTATVTLREGTGKVTIKALGVKSNVHDILYFTRIIHRFVEHRSISIYQDFLFILEINFSIRLKLLIVLIYSILILTTMELDLQHKLSLRD